MDYFESLVEGRSHGLRELSAEVAAQQRAECEARLVDCNDEGASIYFGSKRLGLKQVPEQATNFVLKKGSEF
jgi:hypothetical protein